MKFQIKVFSIDIASFIRLALFIMLVQLPCFADPIYNFYETPTPFFVENNEEVYQRYTPRTITPLIARLPEYHLFGPGYICEKRQPPPVYRFPLQYNRHLGYREADWAKNDMLDKNMYPLEFGGYTY